MIVVLLTQSSKAAKGEQEQGSRGDQQGHRAVVAFHPKGFRCACGKEYGLTYFYHSGRHSFASLITLEAGVPMETICKILGHKDVKMTQRYARVTQKKAHPSFRQD